MKKLNLCSNSLSNMTLVKKKKTVTTALSIFGINHSPRLFFYTFSLNQKSRSNTFRFKKMNRKVKIKRAHVFTIPSGVLKQKVGAVRLIQLQLFFVCCVKKRSVILKIRCTPLKKKTKKAKKKRKFKNSRKNKLKVRCF
ncbi:hypothetical protein AX762_11445 [Alkalibacterium sp. 20]|nr:hypothetical protein AX762_11445 [Alkalibacterium sp. 20]